jgi:MtN3 and saliva related transmembrane protein
MEKYSVYIGIAAGICTSISLVPQLVKLFKEKKAEDISLVMLCVLQFGLGVWLWYGIIKNDIPIIVTNSFSFLVTLLVIILSIRYKT